ncbi:MAG: DNA-binding domain-containing protein [Rickettsiella sp.]|nr:DNA-binding domain-containing protein [Rickettsiella sp.]
MQLLANLQSALQNHLLNEDASITHQLVRPVNGRLAERLAVYANAYRWRLIDALHTEYKLLHSYLGDERFAELSEAYIDEYPSRFYSISAFTKQLPQFLLTYEPKQSYLSELAELIRALSLSLESKDASLLNANALIEVPMQNWPSLCFKFHPSVQCLVFQWNTFALWKALVQKQTLPKLYSHQLGFRQGAAKVSEQPSKIYNDCEPSSNTVESAKRMQHKENSYCIVWRKELQSYANSLTEPEANVFQTLQSGSCFVDACEALYTSGLSNETEAATLVANCLTRWLNDHLFSEVYIP